MKGGLVRIRQYDNYVSIQFMSERPRVKSVLWEVAISLKDIQLRPDEKLQITNLLLKDQIDITLGSLLDNLKNDTPVMKEQGGDDITDVPLNHPEIPTFEEYVAKRIKNGWSYRYFFIAR